MTIAISDRICLTEAGPNPGDARAEFLAGLREHPKRIASKFLYDERGSRLFDRICELDEYYPTRTEGTIVRENISEIIGVCGARCLLVELGSGSSTKTRLLLDHLCDPVGYMPIDISRPHLLNAAEQLAVDYPQLEILPVWADYSQHLRLPQPVRPPRRMVLFFPGSTIGNFKPEEAALFLRTLAAWCRPGDRLIVGVDLVKDFDVLHAAYNDQEGVTADFNLNVLRRANNEFGASFDLADFSHEAFFNATRSRIEMRLVSRRDQAIEIAGELIRFKRDERVVTEYSYKYTPAGFAALGAQSGWEAIAQWTDPRAWFGVFALQLTRNT